jgi:hypothetical protein
MHALLTRRGTLHAWPLALLLAAALPACSRHDEAKVDKVPQVAEVKVDTAGGAVEVKLQDVFPLGPEDAGKVIYATGFVVGKVIPVGFFLKTEGGQVIFVLWNGPVATGDAVRVVGPLRATTAAVFDGWKADALTGKVEADWKLITTFHIEATAVTKM